MIAARGLARSFKTRKREIHAVRGIDLDVGAGEIVGFLGPNGAGKTTTLRMLTTLLVPTGGTATVAGHDLLAEPVAVRGSIGYVAQAPGAEPEARAGEELVDQARLYGLSAAEAARRGRSLLERLDLDGTWERPVKTLSGGQKRRLDVALGLVHDPALLFLDEPTSGLDPQARANFWDHVRALRDELDRTVFLTTHYLEEADALCDRVLVIDDGRIVVQGSPEELKRGISGDAVSLTAAGEDGAARAAQVAAGLPGATAPQVVGSAVSLRVPAAAEALPELFRVLEGAGVVLTGVEVRRPTLDDVFLSLTGRALRDEALAA